MHKVLKNYISQSQNFQKRKPGGGVLHTEMKFMSALQLHLRSILIASNGLETDRASNNKRNRSFSAIHASPRFTFHRFRGIRQQQLQEQEPEKRKNSEFLLRKTLKRWTLRLRFATPFSRPAICFQPLLRRWTKRVRMYQDMCSELSRFAINIIFVLILILLVKI